MSIPRARFWSCVALVGLALTSGWPAAAQDALAGLIQEERAPALDESLLVEGIAAQVGSDIVLVSEVRELAAPTVAHAKAAGASERDLRMIEAQALERLIEKALLKIVVRRAELQATDEELDGTIAEIASDNGITTEQLRASVEAQGLPYAAYRERIKGEIEHSKVVNGVIGSRVEISPDEYGEFLRKAAVVMNLARVRASEVGPSAELLAQRAARKKLSMPVLLVFVLVLVSAAVVVFLAATSGRK